MVNIVTLSSGAVYVTDVAFGGDGATRPLPLIEGHITNNIGTQEIRLIHDNIPHQSNTSSKYWIFQYRNGPDRDWYSYYCFPEVEFLPADFHAMNYFTSTSPDSFQTFQVLIVKYLRNDEGIYGKMMLVNGEVKKNTGGRTSLVKVCKTEYERIGALKEYFGIEFTEEEQSGIYGTITELRAH